MSRLPIINPETWRVSDRTFLAQLKTASRPQLRAQLKVFARLTESHGGEGFAWKRAAVQRELARREKRAVPYTFGWLAQEEMT